MAEAPKLEGHTSSLILDIWTELNNDRPIHMGGIGPIPSASITAYCKQLEIDDFSIEIVRKTIRHIETGVREMDDAEDTVKKDRHDK